MVLSSVTLLPESTTTKTFHVPARLKIIRQLAAGQFVPELHVDIHDSAGMV